MLHCEWGETKQQQSRAWSRNVPLLFQCEIQITFRDHSQFTHIFSVDLDDHIVELEAGPLPNAARAYLEISLKYIELHSRTALHARYF